MVPWVPLLSYFLICVAAALLGWLPFRILEHYSLVEEVKETRRSIDRQSGESSVGCLGCGARNEGGYRYCEQCGRRLPASVC
jgi:hypothetical protein